MSSKKTGKRLEEIEEKLDRMKKIYETSVKVYSVVLDILKRVELLEKEIKELKKWGSDV